MFIINGGMAVFFPFCASKRGQRRRSCLFIWCRSRQNLGVQRIFARIFRNLPEKLSCNLCLQIFSPKDHKDFFCVNSKKKVFMCFSANLGRHFLKSSNVWRYFIRIFRDFAQIFGKSNALSVRLHPLHSHLQQHCFS